MASLQENSTPSQPHWQCPCNVDKVMEVQDFIGNDYFCESGCPTTWSSNRFYTDDPLWDGEGCGSLEQACCNATGIPWFYKILDASTDDNIELRICGDESTYNENVLINQYEIYVK